jgi:hypothetical protein
MAEDGPPEKKRCDWWYKLKANPVKYKEYLEKRTQRRKERLETDEEYKKKYHSLYQRSLEMHPDYKEKRNEKTRLRYRTDREYRLKRYKIAARSTGKAWELTDEEVFSFFDSLCHYCGDPPQELNGMDRKNSAEGYVKGNVVPCCTYCNYLKRETNYDDFVAFLARATLYQNSKYQG